MLDYSTDIILENEKVLLRSTADGDVDAIGHVAVDERI